MIQILKDKIKKAKEYLNNDKLNKELNIDVEKIIKPYKDDIELI